MGEYLLKGREGEEIPREVFYQCLWIVKDIDRLKELAAKAQSKYILSENNEYSDKLDTELRYEPVGREAAFKLDCIYRALNSIPEEYRETIITSIKSRDIDAAAHENTLKKYKLIFVRELASQLRLI